MRKLQFATLMIFFSVIGPGIITAFVDNDAGGITTYSIAGANFGYSMLWTLIPITFLLVMVQEMVARMGVVTRKGLSDLIRENFGVRLTFFVMIALLIANLATTVAEFAGIAAASGIFGISKYIIIPIMVVIIITVTIRFNYKTIEKVFLVLSFFYIAYIISGIMAKPDWGEVARNTLVPSFSLNPYYLLILIGVIGTTITPWMQFYLQSSIVEKGVKVEEYKYSKWDVIIGCILTDVMSFFIIVAVAATLFTAGIQINNASDAAVALKPLAGNYAAILFAFGLFNAALFGAFILPLATSFSFCEGFGWESGLNKRFSEAPEFYTLFIAIIVISASIILIPGAPLITLMITSQIVNGILLPFILICMLMLINNRKVMGDYVNSGFYNIVAWSASAILICLTLLMIVTTFFPNLIRI